MYGHHLSSTTALTRQQARNPSTPANRPNPLSFTPPNGKDWKSKDLTINVAQTINSKDLDNYD